MTGLDDFRRARSQRSSCLQSRARDDNPLEGIPGTARNWTLVSKCGERAAQRLGFSQRREVPTVLGGCARREDEKMRENNRAEPRGVLSEATSHEVLFGSVGSTNADQLSQTREYS